MLAKAHQKVHRQRQDFHRKTALALVRSQRYDLSRGLAGPPIWSRITILPRAFSDAGWSAFLTILTHKAACAGRSVSRGASCVSRVRSVLAAELWSTKACPSAGIPSGVWNEPASGSQRRQEYRTGSGKPFGERGVGCREPVFMFYVQCCRLMLVRRRKILCQSLRTHHQPQTALRRARAAPWAEEI